MPVPVAKGADDSGSRRRRTTWPSACGWPASRRRSTPTTMLPARCDPRGCSADRHDHDADEPPGGMIAPHLLAPHRPAPDPIARDYLLLALRLDRLIPGLVDGYFGPSGLRAKVEAEDSPQAARLRE